MSTKKEIGSYSDKDWHATRKKLTQYINLKLASMGFQSVGIEREGEFIRMAEPLLRNYQEKNRLLSDYYCPADRRIQDFLDSYLKDIPLNESIKLPTRTFVLDMYGIARELSLPVDKDEYHSDLVSSYRVEQGVLHNPKNDRRTTKGAFHIAEGGLPIAEDKLTVPKSVFAKLLWHALHPPQQALTLPFTAVQKKTAETFVSLLLRPVVCPTVKGYIREKSMEIRFFAPGSLVSNLDFVESIFGNAGDPFLPENDAGLDVEHWTGHTGCVILAPHLTQLTKKSVGLPHWEDASERQRHDGMCWRDESELYNSGNAFKVTARDARGVMVTLIADNYFGYCKKEVKTQISMSANLFGLCEEEHSGGAIAYPSYDLGEEYYAESLGPLYAHKFEDLINMYGSMMDIRPERYAIDKKYPNIFYVPENTKFNLKEQTVSWTFERSEQKIRLSPLNTYVLPSGYRIHMEKQSGGPYWRLIGTVAEGILCHKPCTVSGGGKSEISKSIAYSVFQGSIFVSDFHRDMNIVAEILNRNFGDRFKRKFKDKRDSRPVLSPKRSLGSVIKLLTPSSEYTEVYNRWLESIPHHIREIIFVVKRYYRPEWGENWREHFSVDIINGYPGYELKYEDRKLVANYLRVGWAKDGSWRTYKLRQDFNPAAKLQVEDDISVSVVVPKEYVPYHVAEYHNLSLKIVHNCEYRLFQRPDDAINRGYDKQAEADLVSLNSFVSNYEPLTLLSAKELMQDAIGFDLYTEPVRKFIRKFVEAGKEGFIVVPSHPRLINGQRCKNPRYLQNRPDLVDERFQYLCEISTRFFRRIPLEEKIYPVVNAVLAGRRNNPPDPESGMRPLAVYNPIHYQELPELFMDFVCSLTGKSPYTTGAGSEGALTKGPFNALWPTTDLNNALVSYILSGYDGFTSAAGYVGPYIRVDHDLSLLMPEIWSRMSIHERDPKYLIREKYLEKLADFDYKGRKALASRLGFRITIKFVHSFLGRIFNNPNTVFNEDMLKPELQDLETFVDGIDNIVEAQERVAKNYFQDGSIRAACPPLKALLHIMSSGEYEGKDLTSPEIRKMFTRDYLLNSEWYKERLLAKQAVDIGLWEMHVGYLNNFISKPGNHEACERLALPARMRKANDRLELAKSSAFLKRLKGSIGADLVDGRQLRFYQKPSVKPAVSESSASAPPQHSGS